MPAKQIIKPARERQRPAPPTQSLPWRVVATKVVSRPGEPLTTAYHDKPYHVSSAGEAIRQFLQESPGFRVLTTYQKA